MIILFNNQTAKEKLPVFKAIKILNISWELCINTYNLQTQLKLRLTKVAKNTITLRTYYVFIKLICSVDLRLYDLIGIQNSYICHRTIRYICHNGCKQNKWFLKFCSCDSKFSVNFFIFETDNSGCSPYVLSTKV